VCSYKNEFNLKNDEIMTKKEYLAKLNNIVAYMEQALNDVGVEDKKTMATALAVHSIMFGTDDYLEALGLFDRAKNEYQFFMKNIN